MKTECPANCAVCAWDTGASASTTVPVCSVCSSGYVMAADNSCQGMKLHTVEHSDMCACKSLIYRLVS